MPSSAQVSRRTAAPHGYHSFTQWVELDPGTATNMVTDAAGNAYIAVNQGNSGYVAAVAPGGTVLYKTATQRPATSIAVGDNGSLWVGGVGKLDAKGVLTPVSFPMAAIPIATDASGNVYGISSSRAGTTMVVKLNPSGSQIASFDTQIPAYADSTEGYGPSPPAIAVDATGAVYLAGVAPGGGTFPTTPGAYASTTGSEFSGQTDVSVIKIAPTLDRVVYSALIGGDGADIVRALAVDAAGEAIVGGSGEVGIANPFPLTDIGLPVSGDALDAFVLKLSADGSSLIYSAGLGAGTYYSVINPATGGDGTVISMAPLADGSVQALVKFATYGAAVVTIDSAGDAITREQFIPQPPPNSSPVALAPGLNGSTRVLLTTTSSGFPVVVTDEMSTPLIVDLPATVPSADIAVSLIQLWPWACGVGVECDFLGARAVVTNNGPDDAEAVQVTLSGVLYTVECIPNGVASCWDQPDVGHALIPHLAAGATTSIDFLYDLGGGSSTEAPVVAAALALTSEANLANNFTSLKPQVVTGGTVAIGTEPFPGVAFRSDEPGWLYSYATSADPALTAWGPSPQAVNGNLWYFDSWADGNKDNPRVFDASNGVPISQGAMNFLPAQPIGLTPSSLDFVIVPGVDAPDTRHTLLWPVAEAGLWTLQVGTPGASWVTASIAMAKYGQNYAILTGSVNTTGMAPGYYTTTVPVSVYVSKSLQATQNIPISLRIASQPATINPGGVVNAASYEPVVGSDSEIITIFGSGLGPQQLVQATIPQAGSLPDSLAGTRVVIGTDSSPSAADALPLLYVEDGQVSAILPPFHGVGQIAFTVELGGAVAATTTVQFGYLGQAPGVFLDQSGKGKAAAVNADETINSPENPAKRGSMVLLYATGMGTNESATCWTSGNFDSNLLVPSFPAEVNIAGEPALVLYSGSAPAMTCAVQQINVIIPEDSQTGPAVPLSLSVAAYGALVPAQSGLTLAIQ
jgi:uncharacterized protein (TIGR03437 family)